VLEDDFRDDQRNDRGNHEQRGCDQKRTADGGQRRKFLRQPFATQISEKEHQQRADFQRQLEAGMLLFFLGRGGVAFDLHGIQLLGLKRQ